jgi:hypothetical protein
MQKKETLRKMENHKLLSPYDNAPAHRSVWVNDFLAKTNVTTLEHSPHLAAAEFKLFPLMKSALRGR